ncbi:hypothetical protein V2J09_013025 [Rumex salicifolius]
MEEAEELWSWGAGTDGQLATGVLEDEHSPHLLHFPSITVSSVFCGGAHAIALTSCGSIYTWGRGNAGQLGHGDSVNCLHPKLVNALQGCVISDAAAGWNHSGFVSDSGRLFTCGDGSFGQLGHGDYQSYSSPKEVSFFEPNLVSQIACGMRHSLVLVKGSSEDRIYGFGSGKRGQLGVSNEKIRSQGIPHLCLGLEGNKVLSVWANGDHSSAISANGKLYTWGRGFNGTADSCLPSRLSSPLSFTQAALGWNHALLLTGDGETFILGRGLHGTSSDCQDISTAQQASGKTALILKLDCIRKECTRTVKCAWPRGDKGCSDSSWSRALSCSNRQEITLLQVIHCNIVLIILPCLLSENGEIRTWGWGEHGQLGLGDTRDQIHPQIVQLGNKPVISSCLPRVYCGSGFTFVVRL